MFEPVVSGADGQASYVLRFNGSQLVALSNIQFVGTVGIMGMDTISVVAIEMCSFR